MLWQFAKMAMTPSRPCTHALEGCAGPARGGPVSTSFKGGLDHLTSFAQSCANPMDPAETWKGPVCGVLTSCPSCKLETTSGTKRVTDLSNKGFRWFVRLLELTNVTLLKHGLQNNHFHVQKQIRVNRRCFDSVLPSHSSFENRNLNTEYLGEGVKCQSFCVQEGEVPKPT